MQLHVCSRDLPKLVGEKRKDWQRTAELPRADRPASTWQGGKFAHEVGVNRVYRHSSHVCGLVCLTFSMFLRHTSFIAPTPPLRSHSPLPRNRRNVTRMTVSDRTIVAASGAGPARLRCLFASDGLLLMPCCYDGLSARLVERAGFPLTFMSGYSVAGSFGMPDTGLLTSSELRDALARITSATSLPVMADADTGFGNPLNVRRTLNSYFSAGAAGILIEDQVNPKRCGHTRGKSVVSMQDAITRVRAACDERDAWASGDDRPVVFARTDAARFDFEDALNRCRAFLEAGADGTFLEAPRSLEQMRRYCDEVGGWKLANMLEMGETPLLKPKELLEIGYKVAAYPLTMLSAAVKAQEVALLKLANGEPCDELIKSFSELCDIVGFNKYYDEEARYATE